MTFSALQFFQVVIMLYSISQLICLGVYGEEREPRLRRTSIWKLILPWFEHPTPKLPQDRPFFVVWNSPTFRCGRRFDIPMNLEQFGITGNAMELFHGDTINLFYESRLGLYPRILRNGRNVNGGLPQLANLTAHLEWVKMDLDWYIPNRTYDGLAVIDWESWRPVLDNNKKFWDKTLYVRKSILMVRRRFPWWEMRYIKRRAKKEFDSAARRLMEMTSALCRRLRPNAKWGFYIFPECNNKLPGQTYCKRKIIKENDRLAWLFKNSKALYPSIYLKKKKHPEMHRLYVQGSLRETYRVSLRHCSADALVVPYTRYSYSDTTHFYSKSDLESTIGQAADSGAAGVVLWDSSRNIRNQSHCMNLHKYVHETLGPFVSNIVGFTQRCSRDLCNNNGRCVSREWTDYGLGYKAHKRSSRKPRSVPQSRSASGSHHKHKRKSRNLNENDTKIKTRKKNNLANVRFSSRNTSKAEHRIRTILERFRFSRKNVNRNARYAPYTCRCYNGWTGQFCDESF